MTSLLVDGASRMFNPEFSALTVISKGVTGVTSADGAAAGVAVACGVVAEGVPVVVTVGPGLTVA
jgi:hypothetical protein